MLEKSNPDEFERVTALVDDSTKHRHFTFKGFLFWTAVIAGVIPAVLSGEQNPIIGIFSTGAYLTVVCGIATLVLFPRSLDAYLPICGAILLLAVLFSSAALLPVGRMRDYLCEFLFLSSIPLGIYLLIHNVRRIKKRGMSLVVSIYHFGFWVAWVGLTGAIVNAPIT